MNEFLDQELMDTMIKDRAVRTGITKGSFLFFFHFYYGHYVKYKTADFQKEIISNLENDNNENLYIVAFRGSGKSTMVTTAYPIWAILGKQQKKFCVIFCQTRAQAKQHMMNIRNELEGNDVLRNDLGPFQEDSDEWGSYSLVFNKSGARITVASTEQSVRGLRHNEHRPDLIICDDVEDVASTKTREGRNKTYQWLRGEVIPTGDKTTRLIIVGNLLHEDSLLMRIKEEIELGKTKGKFKEYPLVTNQGICLWPGKYASHEEIETERMNIANDVAWQREYLLKIIPTDEQVIHRTWLQFYDEIPFGKKDKWDYSEYNGTFIALDLAISQRETADYTAVVKAAVIGSGSDAVIYILPEIINRRMTFPETVDLCKILNNSTNDKRYPTFIIEDVAYQKALPQQLQDLGVRNVRSVRPGNNDKRARLMMTSHAIKNGKVLFPRNGAEELITQLVNFGVEKHDDLADAFSSLILSIIEEPPYVPRIIWV